MGYLEPWQTFYLIVGPASVGLTGIMFVVLTLIRSVRDKVPGPVIATFSTPTIVHFSLVFAIAAILGAPWKTFDYLVPLLCLVSLGGFAYNGLVAKRLRRPPTYNPVFEDWIWYAIFPLILYGALFILAIFLPKNPQIILFGIGTILILIVLVGLHNAWDSVTYLIAEESDSSNH